MHSRCAADLSDWSSFWNRAGWLLCKVCNGRCPRSSTRTRRSRTWTQNTSRITADPCSGVTPVQAAVATDAVLTAYHAVRRRGQVKKEETVFLFGLGGLGFNALQVIHKVIGARVIVSDIRQERLDAAAELGIPRQDIVPVDKSVLDFIQENGLINKIDATLDFVGEKQTFQDAQQIGRSMLCWYIGLFDAYFSNTVRIAGRMVCVGTLSTETTMNMKIGIRKRLTIIFSYGGQREDLEELLGLMGKNVIMPQTEEGKLEDFPRWLQDLEDGKVKARVALVSM